MQEGDDVATVATNYGTAHTAYIRDTDGAATGPGTQGLKTATRKLFVHSLSGFPAFDNDKMETTLALQNVRIVDGSKINVGIHTDELRAVAVVAPASISIVKVDVATGPQQSFALLGSLLAPQIGPNPPTTYGDTLEAGEVYANPPDEHRDFPIDTLNSDETYTIMAWAVNEDDEVISPVATLNLHPVDKTVTLGTATGAGLRDYLNTTAITDGTLIVTEFTVLK